jgi:hypothetical protein
MRLRSLELATLVGVLGYPFLLVEGILLQYTSCEDVVELAAAKARFNSCSCPNEPLCGECSETSDAFATTQTVFCLNNRVYCLDSSQSECGIFAVQTSLSETATYLAGIPVIAGYNSYTYFWEYTKGPQTGGVFFYQLQSTSRFVRQVSIKITFVHPVKCLNVPTGHCKLRLIALISRPGRPRRRVAARLGRPWTRRPLTVF